jgi:hypothetical protein
MSSFSLLCAGRVGYTSHIKALSPATSVGRGELCVIKSVIKIAIKSVIKGVIKDVIKDDIKSDLKICLSAPP